MPNRKLFVLLTVVVILLVFLVSTTVVIAQSEEETNSISLLTIHLFAIISSFAVTIFLSIILYVKSNSNFDRGLRRFTNNIVTESHWDTLKSVSKTTGTMTTQAEAHIRAFSEASKEDRPVTDDDLHKAYEHVEKFSEDCINIEEVHRFKNTSVREIMNREITTIDENKRLCDLWDYVRKSNHLGFPVVKGAELVGIATFSDLNQFKEKDWKKVKVGRVMTTKENLVKVNPDTSLATAVRLMQDRRIGRILVMEGNELKGIVSRSDIIKMHFA
ncbi:MAG: CBS domain-containing protein [Halobacteriota archaeon]